MGTFLISASFFSSDENVPFVLAVALAAIGLASARAAHAQRTDDNVTAQSDDAFGRSVGNESIGIYNEGEVRGFSPIDAGNVRIEGLYFDRQPTRPRAWSKAPPSASASPRRAIRFPRPPASSTTTCAASARSGHQPVLSYGPFGSVGAEVDAQIPLAGERSASRSAPVSIATASPGAASNESVSFAIMPRWRPTREHRAAAVLQPHRVQRRGTAAADADGGRRAAAEDPARTLLRPALGDNEGDDPNYGLLGAARFGAWTARLGAVRVRVRDRTRSSRICSPTSMPDRTRDELVVAFPDSRFASSSGELRLSRAFEEGARRHTLHFAARGRLQQRRYGGEDVIDVGAVQLGVGRDDPAAGVRIRRTVARRGEAADTFGRRVRAAVEGRRRDERRRAEDVLLEVGRDADRRLPESRARPVAQERDGDRLRDRAPGDLWQLHRRAWKKARSRRTTR